MPTAACRMDIASDDDCFDNSEEGQNDDEDSPISFANILFGNINEKGDLEDDGFLDHVS